MLHNDEILSAVYASIDMGETYTKRRHNVTILNSLPREECIYGSNEVQYKLHTTTLGETIYLRAPGKESKSANRKVNPWDTRPVLQTKDGKSIVDVTLAQVNDTWIQLAKTYPEDLDVFIGLCVLSSYLGYPLSKIQSRQEYIKLHSNWQCKYNTKPKISVIRNSCYDIVSNKDIDLELHLPVFTKEFWKTLNTRYSMPKEITNHKNNTVEPCPFAQNSIESFFWVYDLINQNEDIKYDFYGKTGLTFLTTNAKFDFDAGRIKSGLTWVTSAGIALGLFDGWDKLDLIHHVLAKAGDEGGCRPMPITLLANSELMKKHISLQTSSPINPATKSKGINIKV